MRNPILKLMSTVNIWDEWTDGQTIGRQTGRQTETIGNKQCSEVICLNHLNHQ